MIQICRLSLPDTGERLAAVAGAQLFDLTATGRAEYASLEAWLKSGDQAGKERMAQALRSLVPTLPPVAALSELAAAPDPNAAHLPALPDTQEVWAAGVTYLRSRAAREAESAQVGVYDKVYDAERPELFFKATPHRVAGPGDAVCIRSDSAWNVPEPELTVVLSPDLQVIGYTVGNDMSSRDIEGANPLYLPQAKIYSGCCSFGPFITLWDDFERGAPANIELTIRRDSQVAFRGTTSVGLMKRTVPELVSFLGRHNTFPKGAFLMTGTGIVPSDDFTLRAGDQVEISIDRIGTLSNMVATAA